jgi:hypothetical protein
VQVAALASCPADHPSDDEILALVSDGTAVLITKEIPVSANLIKRLPESVRLLVEAGTGYNNVDMAAARAKGLTVCNVPAYSQEAVAHLVITFVLNHSCSLVEQQQLIEAGDRSNGFSAPLRTPHFELGGKTIGLIGGTGNIGSKVASVAVALGMKVLVSSRTPPAETDPGSAIEIISSVDDLLCRSDFVSIHCPLNDATRHLLGAEKLKLMKPTALLINTARGTLNLITSTSRPVIGLQVACTLDLRCQPRLCLCAMCRGDYRRGCPNRGLGRRYHSWRSAGCARPGTCPGAATGSSKLHCNATHRLEATGNAPAPRRWPDEERGLVPWRSAS